MHIYNGQQCNNCKYWIENGRGNIFSPQTGNGRCHRYAPIEGSDDRHEWPPTMKDDWCGDYAH